MAKTLLSQLRERALVAQVSHEDELEEILKNGAVDSNGRPYAVYAGFDPTARSLHIGNLVVLMGLRRAQDSGLVPIIVFGGATGLIGDPTGRTEMRKMNSREDIEGFIANFKNLCQRYFRFDVPNKPIFVNNIDWLGQMGLLAFARDVGVHFTVARLLAAEVNKSRVEHGLTFMELTYQLLQSYDFLHLCRTYNCVVQLGGNDQWSNILGGADLIRRVDAKKAFAVTLPLLVDRDGNKFGKSAGNAIWLDETMTSPQDFFHFFRNVHDDDVGMVLRNFSFLSMDEIKTLTDKSQSDINRSKEIAAYEATRLVHGDDAAGKALETERALFSGQGNLENAPATSVTRAELAVGLDILSLLVKCGMAGSKGEARRLIQGNGLTFNGEKHSDTAYLVKPEDFATKHDALLLRKGKKDYHLVKLVD